MKEVVIRYVNNEWQIATVFSGLYNVIVGCGSFVAAIRYAEENGWRWTRYSAK